MFRAYVLGPPPELVRIPADKIDPLVTLFGIRRRKRKANDASVCLRVGTNRNAAQADHCVGGLLLGLLNNSPVFAVNLAT